MLDTLASADDKFWPHENWPRVKFNLPLQVGVTGGHGTGPYTVSSYTPGQHIRFEFGGGRQGFHKFTLQEVDDMTCLLRHVTKGKLTFKSAWRWYFLIRPLHNALIEDLFERREPSGESCVSTDLELTRAKATPGARLVFGQKIGFRRRASVGCSGSD